MIPRWTSIALIASAALNLFLVAVGVAVIALGARALHPQLAVMRRAAMSLDADHRVAFVALLRSEGRAARPANRLARRLRAEAWGALADPTPDPAAIKAKLAQARALNQVSRAAAETALVDFAAALPPARRAALGRSLRGAALGNGPTDPPLGRKAAP